MRDPLPPTGLPEEDRPGGEPLDPAAASRQEHDAYAAVRIRNYRRYVAGFTPSSVGLQMLAAAIGWEVYQRTHDPFALGLIGFARALPVLLLTLPAGHIADLYNRRTILVLTQSAFALLAAGLALASSLQAPIWVLLAIMMLTGCIRSFNGPARASLLPAIIPAHTFENAVAWNSGVFQFSAIAGPLVASAIIAATATSGRSTSARRSAAPCSRSRPRSSTRRRRPASPWAAASSPSAACSTACPMSGARRPSSPRSRWTCSRSCSAAPPR